MALLLAPAVVIRAEEAGKLSEAMPTTDVAALKTIIRAEITGGGWSLLNEGEMLLLFANPGVSSKDKIMLKQNPFGDNKTTFYRFRVVLARNSDSITMTLNKELAYTDSEGVARVKYRGDDESVAEVQGILDRVKAKAAALAPPPPSPPAPPIRPAEPVRIPPPPVAAHPECHDVTRCVDITEIAQNAGANCSRGNISITNGCGIELTCRMCAAGPDGRLDCKNVPLSAKSGDKAGQVYAWCDLTGKPFATCTLPNDPASCRSF
jgi:hypothetical protein